MLKQAIVLLLTIEARLVIRKYNPHIVAITGSVGKTSTKDAVYAALSFSAHVRKSEKSFNSELGVPLTILGVPNAWHNPLRWFQNLFDGLFLILFDTTYPEWLVLEVGADRPGDIRSLASWLPVDVAVITRLPEVPVHVEFFDSPEAVVEEKAALIDALKPNGTLVVYIDDTRSPKLIERAKSKGVRIITFGITPEADISMLTPEPIFEKGEREWPIGMTAQIMVKGISMPVSLLGAIGPHMFFVLLAAIAVGEALGENLTDTLRGLNSFVPPPGRMHLIQGIKHTLIIDDTYNSSPAAIIGALDTFIFIKSKESPLTIRRSVAVLGDMLELGRHSVKEHRKVGAHAASTIDLLATVGFRARDIAQGALDAGMSDSAIFQYEDSSVAGEELKNLLQEGDYVLVKGSQSMRMEKIVEEVMAQPERAGELLVRQDREWKRK